MSVYTRFKRNPEGFRALVELLETTPSVRRKKMIDVGMAEDPVYTQRAMDLMMTFEDILKLPDLELAEVIACTPARMVGYALAMATEEIQMRFLKNAQPTQGAEIKDYMGMKTGAREVGGAQMKLIEIARGLEKKGLVKTKRIPV